MTLIAYFLTIIAALSAFAVYFDLLVFAGLHLERSRAKRERAQRLARYVAGVEEGRKAAAQAAYKEVRPEPSAETIRNSHA